MALLLIFQCLPLFLHQFSLPLLAQSLSLSLSLSLFFCSFFLPCFFLNSYFFCIFPSYAFFFYYCLASLLFFIERIKLKFIHLKGFFHQSFLYFRFPVLICNVFQIPFCYLCFSYLKLFFLYNNKVFGFKNGNLKDTWLVNWGLQHNVFVYPVFLEMWKVLVFLPDFVQNHVDVQ